MGDDMSMDAVLTWVDSVAVPLCIALFVLGVVLAFVDSIRTPGRHFRGFKLMAAPVFLLPVLTELR